ncbi:hypothetical protein D9M68_344990 [compost metagenome]
MVADRRAAERDKHVDIGSLSPRDLGGDRLLVVGDNAKIDDLRAIVARDCRDAEAVRGDDLVRPRLAPRRQKLVAGRKDRDLRPLENGEILVVHAGGQCQPPGIEYVASR